MIGITIHGDYHDLKALYNALSDYTRFYFDHIDIEGANSCYETVLGLCYDIRHAFQGDRNFESVDNNSENLYALASCIYETNTRKIQSTRKKYSNGNLYFNVEIHYAQAIYYMYLLQSIAEDIYRDKWFLDDAIEYHYTKYRAEKDLALINYFVQLLWEKVCEHIPEDVSGDLWDYARLFNHQEYYINYPDLYIQWIITYWINVTNTPEMRKDFLTLVCLELSGIFEEDIFTWNDHLLDIEASKIRLEKMKELPDDSEEKANGYNELRDKLFYAEMAANIVNTFDNYDRYCTKYEDEMDVEFTDMTTFLEDLDEYIAENGLFTEESFDEWVTEQLGDVNWEKLDW